MRECSPPITCRMSHVTCPMSHVTCHMSLFFLLFFWTKWWSLLVEGLVSTGPTPSSLETLPSSKRATWNWFLILPQLALWVFLHAYYFNPSLNIRYIGFIKNFVKRFFKLGPAPLIVDKTLQTPKKNVTKLTNSVILWYRGRLG